MKPFGTIALIVFCIAMSPQTVNGGGIVRFDAGKYLVDLRQFDWD
jgi:hypothetical protein